MAILPIILLVLLFLVVAFKLIPVYVQDASIGSILERVASQADAADGGARELLARIGRELEINGIQQVSTADMQIKPGEGGGYAVSLDYEYRKHLFSNLDAVMRFSHHVAVTRR